MLNKEVHGAAEEKIDSAATSICNPGEAHIPQTIPQSSSHEKRQRAWTVFEEI